MNIPNCFDSIQRSKGKFLRILLSVKICYIPCTRACTVVLFIVPSFLAVPESIKRSFYRDPPRPEVKFTVEEGVGPRWSLVIRFRETRCTRVLAISSEFG